MPTYCDDTTLLRRLPPSGTLPADVDTEAERLPFIQDGSALAESGVGPRFVRGSESSTQKFPDITSSPATPEVIQQLAVAYAAALVTQKISVAVTNGPNWQEMMNDADTLAAQIFEGLKTVEDSAGTVYGALPKFASSAATGTKPIFSMGDYDADGNLLTADPGTLDRF